MINLNLTIEEVNYLLNALSSKPFAEVAELIVKIKKQGEGQMEQMQQSQAATSV